MFRKLLTFFLLTLCVNAIAAPSIARWGLTVNNTAETYPGNVLFVDCANKNPAAWARAYLVNQSGVVIQQWHTGSFQWLAKPLGTDGSLLAMHQPGGVGTTACSQSSGALRLDKITLANVVSTVYYDPACRITHDFEIIGDGTYLVLCSMLITDPNVSTQPFFDEVIRRVDGSGNILWSWSTDAHYSQLALSDAAKQIIMAGQTYYSPTVASGYPVSSDVFHTNNIQFIPPNNSAASNPAFSAGNIMVDERNTNLIFVIDYATGNIVWQVGNISVGQHHARVIPSGLPGDGHILLLNNGGEGGYPPVVSWNNLHSSVDEFDPIANTLVWTYVAQAPAIDGFFTDAEGSAQRLPNGNTFIDEAAWGRFFEVDPAGNIVWEYVNYFQTHAAATRYIYRAYKVEPCWPGCNPEASIANTWTW